jgi:hypothetical protein
VLLVADVDEAVIATPAVAVDDRFEVHTTPNYLL